MSRKVKGGGAQNAGMETPAPQTPTPKCGIIRLGLYLIAMECP
jgi:hypothetical protein